MAKVVRYATMALGGLTIAGGLVSSLTACPIATAGIFDSYMSIDGTRRQNIFSTDTKNIVCTAVVTAAQSRPTTVEMLIRSEQILLPTNVAEARNAVLVYSDFSGTGTQSLELKPEPKDAGDGTQANQQAVPFPAGRFRCEIYLDGKLEEALPFIVNFAPCPPQQIEPGAKCGGYYENNRVCPASGLGIPDAAPGPGTFGGTCTCAGDPSAVWVCGGNGP